MSDVYEVTPEEGRELFDRAARAALGISGEEFLQRLDAGTIPAEWPHEAVAGVEILRPFWGASDA